MPSRTAVHIVLILAVGIGLGLTIRWFRGSRQADGPGPNDEVFTNDSPHSDQDVGSIPTHPPEGETWVSQFELIERDGEPFHSDELLGTPYLVSFFFTTCPSTCVQQNQKLKELQTEFQGQGVRFVAISCDPETDTPERLTEYAARFGADRDQWLFMTGEMEQIERLGEEVFHIPVEEKFHAERFILVDPKGVIEGYYSWPHEGHYQTLIERLRSMID